MARFLWLIIVKGLSFLLRTLKKLVSALQYQCVSISAYNVYSEIKARASIFKEINILDFPTVKRNNL